ncbi:MAG: chlorite dismutase family protein, partial [Geodermatophilaceae bacterium]
MTETDDSVVSDDQPPDGRVPGRTPDRGKAERPGEASRVPGRGRAAKEINASIRYTMWSVFRARSPLPDEGRARVAEEVDALFDELTGKGVVIRGVYDVAGLRADADLMIWWHAEDAQALQEAYSRFRRTALGRACGPVWSQMALHRPAEFNKSHVPAFLADEEPRGYVCV